MATNKDIRHGSAGRGKRPFRLTPLFIPVMIFTLGTLHGFTCNSGAKNPPAVEFEEYVWDFGEIREADGRVRHTFIYTNTSKNAVALNHVSVSCGCTMPEYSIYPVSPGDKGAVTITFDPEYRPGEFEKEIHVYNSAGGRDILTVKGTVIPKPRTIRDDYPFAMGDGVRLDRLLCEMGYVPQQTGSSVVLGVANDSETAADISFEVSPGDRYLTVTSPGTIGPGARADVTLNVSIPKGKKYGKFSYRLTPVVNGVKQVLPVTVQGIATDNFGAAKAKGAPKPEFSKVFHELGLIRPGDEISAEVTLTNSGDAPLIIRWVEEKSVARCTLKEETSIAPGKSAAFTVTLDTSAEDLPGGRFSTTLMILTNDPERPARNLTLEADIFKL